MDEIIARRRQAHAPTEASDEELDEDDLDALYEQQVQKEQRKASSGSDDDEEDDEEVEDDAEEFDFDEEGRLHCIHVNLSKYFYQASRH